MKQAFAWWCTRGKASSARSLAQGAARIGYEATEVVLPTQDVDDARAAGLQVLTVLGQSDLDRGSNLRSNHARLRQELDVAVKAALQVGARFVLVSPGLRNAETDGREATEEFLRVAAPAVAEHGLILLLEPLNSLYDHRGAECDTLAWAEDMVRKVNHEALRLLFDCYHVQLSGGDLLNGLNRVIDVTAHVQTAGVPGRHEIDQNQEINYAAIANELRRLGYDGWVSHEIVPTGNDVLGSLRQAFEVFEDAQ